MNCFACDLLWVGFVFSDDAGLRICVSLVFLFVCVWVWFVLCVSWVYDWFGLRFGDVFLVFGFDFACLIRFEVLTLVCGGWVDCFGLVLLSWVFIVVCRVRCVCFTVLLALLARRLLTLIVLFFSVGFFCFGCFDYLYV